MDLFQRKKPLSIETPGKMVKKNRGCDMHITKKGKLTLSVMRNGIIDSVVFPETGVILRYFIYYCSMKLIQMNLFSN